LGAIDESIENRPRLLQVGEGERRSGGVIAIDPYRAGDLSEGKRQRPLFLGATPQMQDTAALQVPPHVALNHLYCTAIKDNMMV